MKRKFGKIKRTLITAVAILCTLSVCTAANAYAANQSNENVVSDNHDYQRVIDKINSIYGTNVHFASDEEMKKYNIEVEPIDISVEEFEAYISEMVEADKEANAMAEETARDADYSELYSVDQKKNMSATETAQPSATSKNVNQSKKVSGATVHLSATVNNNGGFWKYSSINDVYTTYTANVNSSPAFGCRSYSYSLIDTRRTCALKLYGYTVGNYGVIIDSNASRYVEFWAGIST